MRLYQFLPEQWGLVAIRDGRLKVSRIAELNDPFEFLGIKMTPEVRRHLKALKEFVNDAYGLLCLSTCWTHPMLWGHYAESHRGLCLGFDVPDDGPFYPVRYVHDRPTLQDFGRTRPEELDGDDLVKMLFSKFDAWAYESEYRGVVPLSGAYRDPVTDNVFLSFSSALQLREVIVGDRSAVTPERLKSVLGDHHAAVSSFKARPGFLEFEVVRNRSRKAWPT